MTAGDDNAAEHQDFGWDHNIHKIPVVSIHSLEISPDWRYEIPNKIRQSMWTRVLHQLKSRFFFFIDVIQLLMVETNKSSIQYLATLQWWCLLVTSCPGGVCTFGSYNRNGTLWVGHTKRLLVHSWTILYTILQ
jgi:hypothetical protein